MHSLGASEGGEQTDCAQRKQYGANYDALAIRFHVSLLLSCKDTTATCAEESSVVGIDYGVRMELSAQRLGCDRTAGSVFLPPNILEDIISLSE